LGSIIGITAAIYRHKFDAEFVSPNPNLDCIENLLYMMDFNGDINYKPS
jgi:citrate synthase